MIMSKLHKCIDKFFKLDYIDQIRLGQEHEFFNK